MTSDEPGRPVVSSRPIGTCDRPAGAVRRNFVMISSGLALAAFALYWTTAIALEPRGATVHFGADAHLYAPIADGTVYDRTVKFHPVTVGLALGWVAALGPLSGFAAPAVILKALFALVGAIGVGAAFAAFDRVVSRPQAVLFTVIYAVSFGVWYFASIEESKIVTATLCAVYIAIYLHSRDQPTRPRVALLTAVYALACLNEIVSGFLAAIPLVDALLRRAWQRAHVTGLAAHVAAAVLSLVVLEGVVNGLLVMPTADPEARSHFSMLVYYILKNDHGLAGIQAFLSNWLLFNIAAPTPYAMHWANPTTGLGGYFQPTLAGYAATPVSIALCVVGTLVVAAAIYPGRRRRRPFAELALPCALAAYALTRALFFFVFNPAEALLFSPAVTLPHLLVLAILLSASRFPMKQAALAAFAALLFATNASFMFPDRVPTRPVIPPVQTVEIEEAETQGRVEP